MNRNFHSFLVFLIAFENGTCYCVEREIWPNNFYHKKSKSQRLDRAFSSDNTAIAYNHILKYVLQLNYDVVWPANIDWKN